MSGRFVGSLVAAAMAAVVVSLATVPVAGQVAGQGALADPATERDRNFKPIACPQISDFAAFHRCALEKMKAFSPRRTPDGKPDMNGKWNRSRGAMDIEELHGQYGGEGTSAIVPPSKSLVVDPANGRIPYQPWAAEIRRKIASFSSPTIDTVASPADKAYAFVSPSAMCFQLGSQRLGYSSDTYIIQQPDTIVFFKDRIHSHRIVPLDGRPHVGSNIRMWNGDPRGRWEGDTLVIDTTNSNDLTWFDHIGTFMTEGAHLVERLTFVDENTIHYEETITDAKVFTQPWKIVLAWQRSADKGVEKEIWYDDSRENCDIGLQRQFSLGLKPYPGFWAIAPK